MNFEKFCKWIDTKLRPKLESPIMIIMENAKYHNVEIDKKPNTASPHSCIVNWLSQHGVDFNYADSRNKLQIGRAVQQ